MSGNDLLQVVQGEGYAAEHSYRNSGGDGGA